MGTAVSPVALAEVGEVPMAEAVNYYYQPE